MSPSDVCIVHMNLALAIGLEKALVVERLAHWCRMNHQQDKGKFAVTSLEILGRMIPIIHRRTIQSYLADLGETGLVKVEGRKTDQFKKYSVDFDMLDCLISGKSACAPAPQAPSQTKGSDDISFSPKNTNEAHDRAPQAYGAAPQAPHLLVKERIKERIGKERSPTPGGLSEIGASEVWNAYSATYEERYGSRAEMTSRQIAWCKRLIVILGNERAIRVAAYYPTTSKARYPNHPLTLAIRDAEALSAEAKGQKAHTVIQGKTDDLRQTNKAERKEVLAMVDRMMKKGAARGK